MERLEKAQESEDIFDVLLQAARRWLKVTMRLSPSEASQLREAVHALNDKAAQLFSEEMVQFRSEHLIVLLAGLLDKVQLELDVTESELGANEIRVALAESLAEIASEVFDFSVKPEQLL